MNHEELRTWARIVVLTPGARFLVLRVREPEKFGRVGSPSVQFALWGTGDDLLNQYLDTETHYDGHLAGVLADWVEENADEIMRRHGFEAPELIADMVAQLRRHFACPTRNRTQGAGTEAPA